MSNGTAAYSGGGPSKKLGVKYLDDTQLTNSFPDWKALLQRIEEQRQIAEKAPQSASVALECHYPQMYDNVYAILGGRGTGKSSVALTLRNKMRTPCNQDILLPLITPEIISGPDCSILGWIMSSVEAVIVELENRIQRLDSIKATDARLDGFFKNCQFQKENPLRKSYRDLFKKSVQSTGGIDISGYSAEDAVGYKADQSRRQYKLIHDLNSFWNQLTDCWYKVNRIDSGKSEGDGGVKHPLIVLIFDDIDLVPERSMELLTTTFQYFTNPNIVIILTAAERVLRDVIRLKMFERMVGSNVSSLMSDALPDQLRLTMAEQRSETSRFDSIERLASEFYNKVIPPSSRYLLHRYQTIQEKALYSYSQMEQSFIAPNGLSSIPIEDFLIGQIDSLKDSFAGIGGSSSNFLCGGKDGKTFRKAYLTIFGDKSRNIANGCLAVLNTVMRLTQLANQMKQPELSREDNTEILQSLRYLAQTLMFSKPELSGYADQVDKFFQIGLDQQKIIVNYDAAMECYQKERQEIRDQVEEYHLGMSETVISPHRLMRMEEQKIGSLQKKVAALILLLFFIEGFLLTIDGSRKQLHGYRVLNRLLNADVIRRDGKMEDLSLFPLSQSVESFLDCYPLVLEHIDRYVGVEINSRQFAQEYLDDNFRARVEQEKTTLTAILKSGLKMNRAWVKTVLTMLAVRYSGITLLEASFLQMPDGVQEKMSLFAFAHKLEEARKTQAQRFLAQSNLPQESKRLIEEFNALVNREYHWDNWDQLTSHLSGSLDQAGNTYSLLQWNDIYEGLKKRQAEYLQNYLSAYTSRRWNDFMQKELEEDADSGKAPASKMIEQCYALVRFVDITLTECFRIICTKTDIFLAEEDIAAIQNCLYHLDNVTEELRKKKNELTAALKLAASSSPEFTIISDASGQIRLPDQPKGENLWRVSASPLIEYLLPLREAQLKQQREDNGYLLFEGPDLSGYFTLVEYLAVTLGKAEGQIGEQKLPLSWCMIMDLNMVEYLLPYYFAAKMEIALDDQSPGETFQSPNEKTGKLKNLDDRLREFFFTVSQKGRSTLLGEAMQEAQEDLSRSYYSYLEGVNE